MLILRGLPGSGKNYYIDKYLDDKYEQTNYFQWVHCSADDYFCAGNVYLWSSSLLGAAHTRSQEMAKQACIKGIELVIINNTNVTFKEMTRYIEIAENYDYEVKIIDLYDSGLTDQQLAERNSHNVPIEVIAHMRAKYIRS